MPRNEDPGFLIRTATVLTYFPGASPERIEQLITDKLEKTIQEMPELDTVRSESKTGVSVIWVDIKESHKNLQPIWDKLRRKAEKAKPDIPEETIGPFVNDEFGDVFGIILTITGEGYSYAELKDVADEVRDELLLIGDVAKVEIYGAQEEQIFAEYNNARLAELGISPLQLKKILAAENIIIPGGDITTDYEKIVVVPSGNFESLDDLRHTIITIPGRKELLYLEDVVDIYRGYIDPPETKMRSSGEPSLGLAISMREGGNIISLGQEITSLVEILQRLYPIGINFDFVQFQPKAVNKKVNDFIGNLINAVLIVAGVMLVTLGIRTGLVVASLIPMAMLMSLIFMGFFDVGLDQMSLASLIIALGMLVDNAIVMSESIMVQIKAGKGSFEAALQSANELRIPLLTSSLTTAAAFLPIYLAESNTGEYTAPLFKVVTTTLLCSWILSITMIPLFCVKFLNVKVEPKKKVFDSIFYVKYRILLQNLLRNRLLCLGGIFVVFIVTMKGFSYVPVIFLPSNDRPTFTAEIELPAGSPIQRTESAVKKIDTFIKENLNIRPMLRNVGITNWASFIGQGAPRFILPYNPEMASPEYAYMILNATSRDALDKLIYPLESFCIEHFPDIKATIRPLDLGPPTWPPIEIRISGRTSDVLFDIVEKVKGKLRQIPGTKLIDDDWGGRSKKIMVKINQPRAHRAGVTNKDIAISLQTFLSGFETTKFREDDKLIPVTLRSVSGERHDIGMLETLNVYSQATGKSVPLKQVADIEINWQPAKIKRYNRLKTVTVEAGLKSGVTATEINNVLKPWLEEEKKNWGLGYSWEFGGEAETSSKANESIKVKLPVAALIIILLLVGQFNSIRRPIIILITIPLGLIGVVTGLLLANSYFGFMTILGIISLSGIVINNAIVLLDRIRIEIEENKLKPQEAIIESAQRRLRPILLTACTTVGGLLPLWFGGGPLWEPMAIVIIFGLLFATILTLGIVPVLYSLFYRVSFKDFRY
jgi:multidrug efflux pump subunit AcrB